MMRRLLAVAALSVVTAAPAAAQEPEARAGTPADRITISFQNSPVGDVLQAFADFSDRSIVAGPEVTGRRVTAEIRGQPWDVALREILEAHGLRARETETGILRIEALSAVAPDDEAPATRTRLFRIRWARADEIAVAVEPHLTGHGRVSVLPGQNTLLVTDVPESLETVARLIGHEDGGR